MDALIIRRGGGTTSTATVSISNVVIADLQTVSPTAVNIDSVANVTVNGSGFSNISSISIGGETVTNYTVLSTSQIRINQLPSLASGLYDLVLKYSSGQQAVIFSIQYQNEKPVWSTQPSSIYIIPGESVSSSILSDYSNSFGETYELSANTSLPTGLSLSSNGALTGTVSVSNVGTYPITVLSKDAFNQTTAQTFNIVVRDNRYDASNLAISTDYGNFRSYQQISKVSSVDYLTTVFQGSGYSDSNPKIHDVRFSTDGYYMYSVSSIIHSLVQYYCTTPWAVSTARVISYVDLSSLLQPGSFSWTGGIYFKPDGSKLYIAGRTSGNSGILYECNLSRSWMISSIMYSGSQSISAYNSTPGSVYFKPDGTRAWIFDAFTSSVKEWNLSQAWNISTLTYSKSLQFSPSDNAYPPNVSLSINDIGTIFYYSSGTGLNIVNFRGCTMSPAWTLPASLSVTTNINYTLPSNGVADQTPSGVVVINDTPLVAITERFFYDLTASPYSFYSPRNMVNFKDNDNINGNAYTLSGSILVSLGSLAPAQLPVIGTASSFCFDAYGKNAYIVSVSGSEKIITRLTGSTSQWSVSEYAKVSQSMGDVAKIAISRDGGKLFLLEAAAKKIHLFNLTNKYSISKIQYSQAYTLNLKGTIKSFQFSKDGKEVNFLVNSIIYRYPLTVAWDLSTMTSATSFRTVDSAATSFTIDYQTKSLVTVSSSKIETYSNFTSIDLAGWTIDTSVIDGSSSSLNFSTDGTKMYIYGTSDNSLVQFELQTAWDPTTAQSFYKLTANELFEQAVGALIAFAFKSDGSKLFAVFNTGDVVKQYTLTRPWEIASLTYDNISFSITSQETTPTGIYVSPDGTRMYVIGSTGDKVNEYALSVGWDLSTASFTRSISIATQESASSDVYFKSDGTRMYVIGTGSDNVNEYSLSTAWNVSTASYVRAFSVATQETNSSGFAFNSDGTRMYLLGTTADTVFVYNLGTGWDMSTASYSGSSYKIIQPDTTYNGMRFKPDGTSVFLIGTLRDTITEYRLSTPWMISTAKYYKTAGTTVAAQDTTSTGLFFKPDGLQVFVVGSTNDSVYSYTLSSAWEIQTLTFSANVSVAAKETTPRDVYFKTDGTKMYILGSASDNVHEYTLSTPWDITTAVFSQSLSISAKEINSSGIKFNNDGTKMYIIGTTSDSVIEYNLSSAWNISTATFARQSAAITLYQGAPESIDIDDSGKYCYVIGSSNTNTTLIQMKFE